MGAQLFRDILVKELRDLPRIAEKAAEVRNPSYISGAVDSADYGLGRLDDTLRQMGAECDLDTRAQRDAVKTVRDALHSNNYDAAMDEFAKMESASDMVYECIHFGRKFFPLSKEPSLLVFSR